MSTSSAMIYRSKLGLARKSILQTLAAIAVLGWFVGCASHKEPELPQLAANELAAPVPSFLAGPGCMLLTNLPPFRAHLHYEETPGRGPVEGEFFGNGQRLFFAREPAQESPSPEATAVAYILDVSQGRGWLLSDALQGYAPLTASTRATNVLEKPLPGTVEIEGYRCSNSTAVVALADGYSVLFQLVRAHSLSNFPLRIAVISNATPAALTFSKVSLKPPPDDLFKPPRGFTPYSSSSAMLNECLRRQLRQTYSSP